MNGQSWILQDRIEIAPFERRLADPQERIRRDQNEQIEGDRDPGLDAEHVGAQSRRQIAAEQCHQCSECAENQHPQQHGAFMVAPDATDLIDKRLRGMRIFKHVENGEI